MSRAQNCRGEAWPSWAMPSESERTLQGISYLGEQAGVWAPGLQSGGCQSTQMFRSDSPPGSPQAPLHISS